MRRAAAVSVAVLLLTVAAWAPAWGESAVERGRVIFKQCQACHSLEDGVTVVGPSLHALFGRHAASLDGYEYSDALYGADFAWDAKRLATWLADPATLVPGNKMLFPGIKDARQIADLIAYLSEATR